MKVKLLVGEPWDFESKDGENLLACEVDEQQFERVSGERPDSLIAQCTPFSTDGLEVSSLLLVARHEGVQLIDDLLARTKMLVNAYWLKDGQAWNQSWALAAKENADLIGGFLIAGIEIDEIDS